MLYLWIDTDFLLLWAIGALFLVILFYMFWDVHYFVRMFLTICFAKLFQHRLKIDETGVIYGVCTPADLEALGGHMAPARFVRELDFARLSFCERAGLRPSISNRPNGAALQAVNYARFHRRIPAFAFYQITTKLVYWDERALYLEHRFVSFSGEVEFAQLWSKLNCIGLDVHLLVCRLGARDPLQRPPKPAHLDHLCKGIAASSRRIKEAERATAQQAG